MFICSITQLSSLSNFTAAINLESHFITFLNIFPFCLQNDTNNNNFSYIYSPIFSKKMDNLGWPRVCLALLTENDLLAFNRLVPISYILTIACAACLPRQFHVIWLYLRFKCFIVVINLINAVTCQAMPIRGAHEWPTVGNLQWLCARIRFELEVNFL